MDNKEFILFLEESLGLWMKARDWHEEASDWIEGGTEKSNKILAKHLNEGFEFFDSNIRKVKYKLDTLVSGDEHEK